MATIVRFYAITRITRVYEGYLRKHELSHLRFRKPPLPLPLIDLLITPTTRECNYLVRLKMINDAGEGDVTTLNDRMILQKC